MFQASPFMEIKNKEIQHSSLFFKEEVNPKDAPTSLTLRYRKSKIQN
jgi:hypothetical protein